MGVSGSKNKITISIGDNKGKIEFKEHPTGFQQMPSVTPQEPCDECEVTFKDDNAVSRLSVRDIIYANAYELEYPDSSSEYVVNRDELIKYLMELPPVYSKMAEPQESEDKE